MSAASSQVWLGHGASGGPETMQPYIRRLSNLASTLARCGCREARPSGR